MTTTLNYSCSLLAFISFRIQVPVSPDLIRAVASKIHANTWLECSAKLKDGVQQVFQSLIFQCDQMTRLFVQYLAMTRIEILPNSMTKIAKVGSKFCQLLANLKCGQKLLNFNQIGAIWPNLVTLGPP